MSVIDELAAVARTAGGREAERAAEAVRAARTFAVATLGCRVNQAESEGLARALVDAGLEDHGADGDVREVDLLIVNTCAVTGEAEAKSRKLVRHLARTRAPRVVAVVGCGARTIARRVGLDGVLTVALTNDEKRMVLAAGAGARAVPARPPSARTRAFLKVQDGCNGRCSYCIVPLERGPERSRPVDEVLREAEALEEAGVAEVVLCGVHLGRYGVDLGGRKPITIAGLARALAGRFSFRVRLSSIDVEDVSGELVEAIARGDVCPHLHVPLQSGSDAVLARMRRPYTREFFLERIHAVREGVGRLAVSTDVMVGFPGETDDDFEETVTAIEGAGFMRLHVFRYSPRPGTEAAGFAGAVPPHVARERAERLAAMSHELEDRFLAALDGHGLEVVVEERGPRESRGRCEYYVPVTIAEPMPVGARVPVDAHYVVRGDEATARGMLIGEVVRE